MTRSHRLPASATATPSTSHVPARVPGGPLLRRRGVLLGSVALATTAVLAACGSQASSASVAAPSGSPAVVTDDGATTPTAPEYLEASSTNTVLSPGTWTGTIGDKEVTLSGAYLVDGVDATIEGGTWQSTTGDQTVFLVVNGGSLTLAHARVVKTGDASTNGQHGVDDAYNFYGLNSAVVAVGAGSTISVSSTTIETSASGANAVLTTAAATATVTACAIATTGESSRGLHATYTGVIEACEIAIDTQGAHCAAVATDRGSGTVTVTGTNVFTTSGDGSPCIYSTGDITVSGLTGTALGAQAVVVEGRNHATVSDSVLTTASQTGGVMLYQSMSGDAADADAATEVSTLRLSNVTLTCTQEVAALYVTNTSAEAVLTDCRVTAPGGLLRADEDRWGTSGSNGGTLALTMDGTVCDGAMSAGDSSRVTVTTTNGGSATGAVTGTVTVSGAAG